MHTKTTAIATALALGALASHAASITWTGNAGDYWWGTAANWSTGALPTSSDTVSVGDDVAINANASTMLPEELVFGEGASLTQENNELQFSGASTVRGGTVVANLLAAQSGNSSVTIVDCQLTNKSTGHVKGFWRNDGTAHVNFEFGDSGSASYTFQSSLIDNDSVYGTFAAGANPLVKFGGANVASQSEFDEIFEVATDDVAGTTTLSLKTPEGWKAAVPAFGEIENGQVSVTYAVTHFTGGAATISIGCASSDLGADVANWGGHLEQVATGVTDSTTATATVALAAGINYVRVFVVYDGVTVASGAAAIRNLVYGDYGELTGVYEYVGADNNLATPTNWALDKVPLGENDTAPVAGTDIRWFGRNAVLSLSGNFHLYETDHFVGATITQANAGNHDSNLNGDVTFEDSSVTLSTVVVQADPHTISLKNAHFATTRAPDGVAGFYVTVPANGINYISGFPSSFSFGADAGDVHDAATVKSQLVDSGKITLDGAAITDEQWENFFEVNASGSIVTISYDPVVSDNRISAVDATSTAVSATLTATIHAIDADASVYVACDTDAVTEANIIAKGEVVAVSGGVATKVVSLPVSSSLYHYAFAIVKDGAVAAFKAGSFFASDFDYVYMNGAWLGNEPATLDTDASVLILDAFNNAINDIAVANTVVSNAAITSTGTIKGNGTMQVYSSQITNNKLGDAGAVCGTWGGSTYMNFVSLSGGGVIYPACAFTFNAAEEWKADAFNLLFDAERIHLDGAKVGQAAYESNFTLVQNRETGNETTPYNLTLTYWEPFPAGASGDWTVKGGARVKLDRNVSVGELTIESSDVRIDLNGKKLAVSALTVGGVSYKGTQTSATLPAILVGDGTLEIGETGTVIVFR